jgi:hypothetical protein
MRKLSQAFKTLQMAVSLVLYRQGANKKPRNSLKGVEFGYKSI